MLLLQSLLVQRLSTTTEVSQETTDNNKTKELPEAQISVAIIKPQQVVLCQPLLDLPRPEHHEQELDIGITSHLTKHQSCVAGGCHRRFRYNCRSGVYGWVSFGLAIACTGNISQQLDQYVLPLQEETWR